VGLHRADRPGIVDFTYDIPTMTATWRFADLVANDQYAIVLSHEVTDIEGNSLDGEWVNPSSLYTVNLRLHQFPSGNGQSGGDFVFVVTLLAGDFTLDNYVADDDEDIFWNNYYWVIDGVFTDGDANGDGVVDDDDGPLLWSLVNESLDALWLVSDLNHDWVVDDLDEDILMSNIAKPNPMWSDGDLNRDGVINIDDLDLMFAQYGLELDVAV
jgi:hypothetical protein